MTKIALISDSHGRIDRLEQALNHLQQSGITTVIHAGDFLVEGVVEVLRQYPDLSFFIARGNCDVNEEAWANVQNLPNVEAEEIIVTKIEGINLAVSHIQGVAQNVCQKKGVDIFIHGHTHRRKIEPTSDPLLLNPGALTDDGRYLLLSLPEKTLEVQLCSDPIIS